MPFFPVTSVSMLKQILREQGFISGAQEPVQEDTPKEIPPEETLWKRHGKDVYELFYLELEQPKSREAVIQMMVDSLDVSREDAVALFDLALQNEVLFEHFVKTEILYGRDRQECEAFAKEKALLFRGLSENGPFEDLADIRRLAQQFREFRKEDGSQYTEDDFDQLLQAARMLKIVRYDEEKQAWFVSLDPQVKLTPVHESEAPKPVKSEERGRILETPEPTKNKGEPVQVPPVKPTVQALPESKSTLTAPPVSIPAVPPKVFQIIVKQEIWDRFAAMAISKQLDIPVDKALKIKSEMNPEKWDQRAKGEIAMTWELVERNFESFRRWLEGDAKNIMSPPATPLPVAGSSRFQDKTRWCRVCGKDFIWTAGDQEFFSQRGFFPPSKCRECNGKERHEG